MKWYLLRQIGRAVLVTAIVLSVTVLLFTAVANYEYNRANQEEPENNASAQPLTVANQYNFDRPLYQQYVGWMERLVTLNFGTSVLYQQPVTAVLGTALPVTLLYAVPGVLVGTLLSLLTGLFAAFRRQSLSDRGLRLLSYLGFGVPSFALAEYAVQAREMGLFGFPTYDTFFRLLSLHNLGALVVPMVLVGLTVFGVQLRVVRTEALTLLGESFAKTLRANGATRVRMARHVLRNATAPLLALFTAETLTVFLLTVFLVEPILSIPGYGQVALRAFVRTDLGLVFAAVAVPVVLGAITSAGQDIVAGLVDPRVRESAASD